MTTQRIGRVKKSDMQNIESFRLPRIKATNGKYWVDDHGIVFEGRMYLIDQIPPQHEVELAQAFFREAIRLDGVSKQLSIHGYQLKHLFEPIFGYCSNGAVILAASNEGVPLRVCKVAKIDALLPISLRWLEKFINEKQVRRETRK
jgi:hypothetical protein